MTSGDLTMEETKRLQTFPKPKPGPIRDLGDLTLLLDLAGMFCSASVRYEHRSPFYITTAELMAEASTALDDGQFLSQGDVETVLPGMKHFHRVKGGWQWR